MYFPLDPNNGFMEIEAESFLYNLINGRQEKWWLRIPIDGGCKLILFPKAYPRGLNPQDIIDILLSNEFVKVGELDFFHPKPWNKFLHNS
jgi:hypothetical protein